MRRFGTSLIAVALVCAVVGCGPAARHSNPWYELPISRTAEKSVVMLGSGTPDHGTGTAIGKAEYLDLSACELIDKLFDKSLTELQREELWKAYRGGRVRWIGKLEDVKPVQDEIVVTFSPSVEVVFDKSQMGALLELKKGELCEYSGILDGFRYPYSSYSSYSRIKLRDGSIVVPEVVSLLWEKEVPVFDEYELHMALPSKPCFLVRNDRIFKGPGEVTTWFGDFKVFGINKLTGEVTWEKELPPPESVAQGECRGGKLVAADNDGVYVCVWFQEHRGQSVYRDTYEIFALDGSTGKVTQQRSLQYEYGGLPYLHMKWENEINDLIRSIAGRELVFCTEQTLPKEATYCDLVFKWTHRWYGLQACDRVTGCVLWSKQVVGPVVYVETSDATLRVLATQTFYAFRLAMSDGESIDETEAPGTGVPDQEVADDIPVQVPDTEPVVSFWKLFAQEYKANMRGWETAFYLADTLTAVTLASYIMAPVPDPIRVGILAASVLTTIVGRGLDAYAAIMVDPPDESFREAVTFEPVAPVTPCSDSPLAHAHATVATTLQQQNAILHGVLVTLERLQGAEQANEPAFVALQATTLRDLSLLLISNQQALRDALTSLGNELVVTVEPVYVELKHELNRLSTEGLSSQERQQWHEAGVSLHDIETVDGIFQLLQIGDGFHEGAAAALYEWADWIDESGLPALNEGLKSVDALIDDIAAAAPVRPRANWPAIGGIVAVVAVVLVVFSVRRKTGG